MKVKHCPIFSCLRFIIIKFFYPIIQISSIFSNKLPNYLQKTFIKLNNATISGKKLPKNPKLLILLPHCLQFDDCKFRITKTIENCKKCGKCVIKDFVDLKEEMNIQISISTGGTLARKAVALTKPDLVIACACERDLSSGIHDAYPIHVYGILNEKPNGPCVNTTVDIAEIEKVALSYLS